MKVTLNPAVSTIRNTDQIQQNKQTPNVQTMTAPMQNNSQQVAFTGWFGSIGYYFAKKLDDGREEKKQAQFEQVRKTIHDDIKFMAERQGISLAAARQRYEDNIDAVAIPLKYDGNEEGLNKIVGYSLEKYKAMMEIVLPLIASKTNMSKEYPVPNGVLLYGPGYTGKTHFAKALGEHIELKNAGEFKQYYLGENELADDDPVPLLNFINVAEERFKETGKRQILFFDNLELLLDKEESPMIRDVLLAKMENCAKNGITWIGTTNFPGELPDLLYKPSRLNSDIMINKMSDGEKSATMSYFWTQRDRKDDSDHNSILNRHRVTGFHFYPPEVNDVSKRVDEALKSDKDRGSYLSSDVKVKKPVKTDMVNEQIDRYLGSKDLGGREIDTVITVQANTYNEYVKTKRGKYANK